MLANLDPLGGARMVDVTPREPTHRRALARLPGLDAARDDDEGGQTTPSPGRRAGGGPHRRIQAAKRTAELIPMCHPVLVGSIGVNFSIATTTSRWRPRSRRSTATGVEMEAMTACAVAALTVYDMCKFVGPAP